MKKTIVALILLQLFSVKLLAADGSSGCGPGWYLFKENSILSSALRGTTNAALFPVVTIGMTVGTSNCTQHKLVLKEKESLYFATMNHFELKSEIAKGEGNYLSAFGTTMGCSQNSISRLGAKLKSNYQSIYSNTEIKPENVLLEVYKTILNDKKLVEQCSLGQV